MKILITGASRNVGLAIIKNLVNQANNFEIFAGSRNVEIDKIKFQDLDVSWMYFDFEDINTFKPALYKVDILFLLRPPQLADVDKHFKPLIYEALKSNIKNLVFYRYKEWKPASLSRIIKLKS